MFKVGDVYRFRIIQDGDEWQMTYQVKEVQWPLIKLYSPHDKEPHRIYNVGSLNFVGAELLQENADENYWKAGDEYMNTLLGFPRKDEPTQS